MIHIYNDILDEIKPSDTQRKNMLDFSNKLMDIITSYASSQGINITCHLVGSMAKKTSLVNKADIDIFMAFSLDCPPEDLKKYGLEFGRHAIETMNAKSQLRFASHPYITGLFDDYEVDFVPCYKISDASQLRSAVDRTILHTEYIQSHMSDSEADEVLLLKKFMSSVNTYGANYKVSGFSGYLCELLILRYKSFDNVIREAATNWSEGVEIDLENYGTCGNYSDPMIVIDPTDANRNVAAALTIDKFSEFIIAARNYLDNPSREYFSKHIINTSKDELSNAFIERGTSTYVLKCQLEHLPTDVIYPQINKTTNSLERVSRGYDFSVIGTRYYMDDNDVMYIIIEYETSSLSNIKIHNGPRIDDVKNSNNFKNKYPDSYIHKNRLQTIKNRKYSDVMCMLRSILKKENMSILKLGKNVKESLIDNYEIYSIHEFIKKEEDLDEVYLYLHPTYELSR
ncbi:MAG: CCA tRNA nucleotidyltransferase [Methanosphaera sp.]|nr:CCA tRNA nucleotidyltransferase [Methanosphaera sp.]